MKNTGTLVGAPIRPADSEDLYPSAYQSEIKGGHHSRATLTERDAIKTHLREAGMTCYVEANEKTYELDNDLLTWKERSISGGTTDPASGGTSDTTPIISGNFGVWLNLPNISTHIATEDSFITYKVDMAAFVGRAIVYLHGQCGLSNSFSGTEITIGTLPINSRPIRRLKKYFITKNIELFLVLETNGDVKIVSKDGLNLPVDNADQPYYIDTFFEPLIHKLYYATRTENFTKKIVSLRITARQLSLASRIFLQ